MKKGLLLIMSLILIFSFAFNVNAAQITLEIWDNQHRAADSKVVENAIEEFKRIHPEVEIRRIARPLEDLQMQIMAAVPSRRGPDILTINNGETMMGPLVRGNHILSLDKYAEKYGWNEKVFSPVVLDRSRYSADGTTAGKGNLYAIAFMGEVVGVYYNKDIFTKLGIAIPESVEEFEAALAIIKRAGIIPLAYGGLDDWQFFHLYAQVQGSTLSHYMGADEAQKYLDDLVLRWDEGVSFINEGNKEAAAFLQNWVKKGYFINGFSGLNGDDAFPIFLAGQTAMFIQGSWYAGDIGADHFGFFPFPPYKKAEKLPPQVGGTMCPLGISRYTKYPDLAAEFLNILVTSEQTEKILVENNSLSGKIPVELSGIKKGTLKYDLYNTWNIVNNSGRLGHYLDWISPTMWDTLSQAGRQLMDLKITPEKFVELVENDYLQWQKEKPGR